MKKNRKCELKVIQTLNLIFSFRIGYWNFTFLDNIKGKMRGMEWISQSRLICKLYQLFFKYWKKYQSLACFNTDNLFENSSLLKEITSSPQSSENLKYQTVQILQGGGVRKLLHVSYPLNKCCCSSSLERHWEATFLKALFP